MNGPTKEPYIEQSEQEREMIQRKAYHVTDLGAASSEDEDDSWA